MAYTRRGLGSGSLHDPELLAAALVGYQQQRSEIETKIAELRRQLGGRWAFVPAGSADGTRPARKRPMSVAARRRIGAAQRRRWAEFRKEHTPAAAKKSAPAPKRKMSAAARKRIAAAQRKRWAEVRGKKGASAPKVKKAGA